MQGSYLLLFLLEDLSILLQTLKNHACSCKELNFLRLLCFRTKGKHLQLLYLLILIEVSQDQNEYVMATNHTFLEVMITFCGDTF